MLFGEKFGDEKGMWDKKSRIHDKFFYVQFLNRT